jgi:zinc transport system permease protein
MHILDIIQLGFLHKALLAGSCVAVACALLGVFLVLKRMSLIGDGLAHVAFGAVALGLFLNMIPIVVAVPVVVLASLGILLLAEKAVVYGDAAIGMVSAVGIAIGVVLASSAGGFNADLFGLLFGNILAISTVEAWEAVILSGLVIIMILLFYHDLFMVSFDEQYGRVAGINTTAINRVLAMLTAFTVVLGIRVVGTMLVSALMIFPAVTALQLGRSFRRTLVLAALIAVLSVLGGIALSFAGNYPTGATIVLVNAAFLVFAFFLRKYARSE